MHTKPSDRRGFAWLEFMLALAFLALLLQVFPSLWQRLIWALDARHWSRGVWIGFNVVVILALFGVRLRHELKSAVRAVLRSKRPSRSEAGGSSNQPDDCVDYEARARRDAEWRERARKRLPFT